MKRHLLLAVLFAVTFPFLADAQFEKLKDSVIQLYGVVMTADSLKAIPSVSVTIKGERRGTQTNEQGVFSIVVQKGDVIEFTSIGYKPKLAEIPRDLEGNHYSLIQLMVTDAEYLPATIIKPRPTKEQFDRDFVNVPVPDDALETARKNNDESKRRVLARTLPRDGGENSNLLLNNNARRATYYGQTPPQNIFNPMAWAEFIKAWKRGDFKNSK
ncbi:carboxypeptidase-like regulatory domain-containing protein [Pseudoflavitalea sp. X16]|uniref:carboxypeptidase-like regulatory domain-containing protein n=1 Tax=Paraflavitalea devenefica TaxID=2716334 RepID=UPI0014234427|nr:carboxypeptidase-like regulatory domain-containing protein [Paraflavitalea devenefica]NII25550.1 carboxypeptidase-like regulatory domain-containing protein [Paraflavitalea devenefica]